MAEKKYKLLIADDEYWTREKIRNMFDWEEYSIDFMEPAKDGEEVLLRMEEEPADILITDINMPFINGVELVKLVKEKYPDVVIFIISGYDDFEYVKSTLMAGAINYLLKPVTKIDLVSAVSKALEILSKTESDKQNTRKMASLIQDQELSMLVEKEVIPFTPTVSINGRMDFAGCSLMLVKIHNLQELMELYHYDMNLLSYSIKKGIKELLKLPDLLIFNYVYRSNEFLIVSEQDNAEQNRMAIKILGYIKAQTKAPVSIVISEHTYSIESIHSAYVQCVSILMTRRFCLEDIILIDDKKDKEIYRDVKNYLSDEQEVQLKRLLHKANKIALGRFVFDTIGLSHSSEMGWGFLETKQTLKKISNLFMDYLVEENQTQKIMDMESLIELAGRAIETLDVENLNEIMNEMIELMEGTQKEEMNGTIRSVITQAIKYIDANYFEELTLNSLALKYNVDSSYFSRLFRQEAGDNLMLYIAKKRIEKAKVFINDDTTNLAEVAFMVGYDDYTYFSKVFKKMTGKSPRDYRGSIHEK